MEMIKILNINHALISQNPCVALTSLLGGHILPIGDITGTKGCINRKYPHPCTSKENQGKQNPKYNTFPSTVHVFMC